LSSTSVALRLISGLHHRTEYVFSAVLVAGWRIVVLTSAERARCSSRTGSVADGCSRGNSRADRGAPGRTGCSGMSVVCINTHSVGDRRDREGVVRVRELRPSVEHRRPQGADHVSVRWP
jgi:hypothetical protein